MKTHPSALRTVDRLLFSSALLCLLVGSAVAEPASECLQLDGSATRKVIVIGISSCPNMSDASFGCATLDGTIDATSEGGGFRVKLPFSCTGGFTFVCNDAEWSVSSPLFVRRSWKQATEGGAGPTQGYYAEIGLLPGSGTPSPSGTLMITATCGGLSASTPVQLIQAECGECAGCGTSRTASSPLSLASLGADEGAPSANPPSITGVRATRTLTERSVAPQIPPVSGKVIASPGAVDLLFSLGGTTNAAIPAGNLRIQEKMPRTETCSPNCLVFDSLTNEACQVIYNGGSYIQQVKTPEGLVDVQTNSAFKYSLRFYRTNGVGAFTGGKYSLSGSPFATVTIENPDTTGATTNRLKITATDGKTYEYLYYTNGWKLSLATNKLHKVQYAYSDGMGTNTSQTEIRDGSGNLLQYRHDRFFTNSWGPLVSESAVGSGQAAKTNKFTYGFSTNGAWRLRCHSSGDWEWTEYDYRGLPTNVYRSFGNQTPTNLASLCRLTSYDYSTNQVVGSGDDGGNGSLEPRLKLEKVLGQEVARTYYVFLDGESRVIQAANPGATWDNSSNLVTIHKTVNDGGAFQGRPSYIERPDGTISIYTYTKGLLAFTTNTVATGEPNGTKTSVINGTKRTIVLGSFSEVMSDVTIDIVSGLTLESVTYSDFDEERRPRKRTYLDGTFEATDYGCCGPVTITNRTGVVTKHLFDEVGRRIATIENSISVTNILGADGLERVQQRVGTDSSVHTLDSRSYDLLGRVVSITNAASGVTTYSYGLTNGQPFTLQVHPDGSSQTDLFNKDGTLDRTTGTAVHGVRVVYGVESESGVQRFYTKRIMLDASGNDTSEWTKAYEDMLGQNYKTLLSDANGSLSQQVFNSKGQLIRSVDLDGVTTLYQYDATGALEYTALDQDRDGVIDFAGLDRIQRAQSLVTTAHGYNVLQNKSYVWATNNSAYSNLVSTAERSTDGLRTWDTSFGLTRTSVRTTPVNASWTVTTTEPDNSYSITLYQTGRLASVTRYDSNSVQIAKTSYGYDAHGRQHQTTDARNGTTTQVFNNADQVTSVTTPVPGNGQAAQATSYEYDSRGRVVKTTYPDSTSLTNEYFLTGELKKTFGSRTYPVEYTYDSQGRMKTMKTWKDFAGNSGTATNTWNYDGYRGFLTNKVYPDGIGPSYTYTAGGKLKTRKWARNITTTYTTNSLGDTVSIDYSDSTPDVTFTLDRQGRKTSINQGSDTTEFLYTEAGLPVSEKGTAGTLNGLTITNQYDTLMRRSSVKAMITSPSTTLSSATYGYDAASRLLGVTNGNYSVNYSYLGNSPLVNQLTFRESTTTRMTTTKSYDYLNRLLSISSTAASSVISSHGYVYNDANQRTRVDLVDGSYWIYEYDKLGQVIAGRRYWADGSVVAGQQFDYAFDDIGNRSSTKVGGDANGLNQRSATYSANNLNQYTSRTVPGQVNVSGIAHPASTVTVNSQSTSRSAEYYWGEATANNASAADFLSITSLSVFGSTNNSSTGYVFVPKTPEAFSYDADGNLTNDGRWVYTWDAENRLIQLESQTTAPSASKRKITYTYDFQSRMVARKSYTNNGSYQIKSDTKYLNDGWRCLAEVNATNNNVIRGYVWGLDLSGSLEGAGGIGGLLMLTDAATSTSHFYAYDGNGNVSAMAKTSDSSKTAHYEYGPFGEVTRASGTFAKSNPVRFSTKCQDEESDLLYYGYRFYSASTGRWPNRDPLVEEGGVNLYGFSGNAGINYYDILGLAWKIERKGQGHRRAHAKPDPGDTVADLAKLIGFDDKDYQEWLQPVGPSSVPSSATEAITGCAQFTIPNTVFIEFGQMFRTLDGFGPISDWRSSLTTLAQNYRADGFNVVLTNPSDPETAKQHLQSEHIHGFAYAGHGGGGDDWQTVGLLVFAGGEGATSLDSARYTKFGINFLYAYACSSANRNPISQSIQQSLGWKLSPWEKNVSTRGKFKGVWGEVNGYQTWSHIVDTPGTNR